jgi:phage gp46-like protein
MTDIHLKQVVTDLPVVAVSFDWLMTPLGTFDTTQELATAVTVALGTDRLAELDDILPGFDETDRRGWWGDLDAEFLHDGWPIGSRIWLLARHKITGSAARQGSSTARAQEYVFEALQPLVDRKICSSVEVTASRAGTDRIDVEVILYRGPEPALALRYSSLWDEIEALASLPTPIGPYGV